LIYGTDTWNGMIYKPSELTQLTYRLNDIKSDLDGLAMDDENIKEGDYIYAIGEQFYILDERNLAVPYEVNLDTEVELVNANFRRQKEKLLNDGYQNTKTDLVDADMVAKIALEENKGSAVHKDIDCYMIHYGYYDTLNTYHTWTEFKGIYGVGGDITKLVNKPTIDFSGIKKMVVSRTVSELGYKAFENFADLETIVLPETLIAMENNPVANGKVTAIRINEDNLVYGDHYNNAIVKLENQKLIVGTKSLVDNEGKLPSTIKYIGDYAFERTTISDIDLTNYTVAEERVTVVEGEEQIEIVYVNYFGEGVFKDCVNLVSVKTNEMMTEIPKEMFSGCVSLEDFRTYDYLEVIGSDAFANCELLREIDLPITIREIGKGAFSGCEKTITLYYVDSRKTFNANVSMNYDDYQKLNIQYALKDITYEIKYDIDNELDNIEDEGKVIDLQVDLQKMNADKLNPALDTNIVLNELNALNEQRVYRYKFTGWSVRGTLTASGYADITANGSGVYNLKQSNYNEDITLTANYERIVFFITYKIDNATLASDNEQIKNHPKEYNNTQTTQMDVPELEKRGYTFDGWYLGGTKIGTKFTPTGRVGNVTLSAKFILITYNISYNTYGGTVPSSNKTTYTVETPTFNLNNPIKQDYDFIGWIGTSGLDAEGVIENPQMLVTIEQGSIGDREFTSKYTPTVYSLTYNLSGGVLATANPKEFTVETLDINLNSPTRKGYTFDGWKDDAKNIGTYFDCSEYHANTVLTALFTANVYTINYTFTGTTYEGVKNYNNVLKYTYDTEQKLNNPEMKTGYNFVSWSWKDNDGHSGTNIITKGAYETVTATAKIKIQTYTLIYDLKGGELPTGKTNPATYNVETPNFTLVNPE
ncbi:MAG: leucine-rich repeat protein, partial [Clostridia bacterium]|nr:leucine-rich repeat protein [Clostridia bacterium]